MEQEKFFGRRGAAAYVNDERGLPCKPNTLQKYATTGNGPEYQRFGNRAVYTKSALDAWVDEKLSAPRRTYKPPREKIDDDHRAEAAKNLGHRGRVKVPA